MKTKVRKNGKARRVAKPAVRGRRSELPHRPAPVTAMDELAGVMIRAWVARRRAA